MSDIGFENIDWNNIGSPDYLTRIGVDPTTAARVNQPPPGAATTVGGIPVDQRSGRAIVQAILRGIGIDITPELDGYVTDLVTTYGNDRARLADVLNADTYDTSSTLGKVINQKYPVIAKLNTQQGFPPTTVGNVLDYRRTAADELRTGGLPPGFYDSPDDFDALMLNRVSPSELHDRVQQGYVRVANADPTIRSAFNQFFGADGDAALASYFLDPAKAVPALEKHVAAATVGGVGTQFNFGLSRDRATELADRGVTEASARQGFSQIQSEQPLFNETISENTDLTAEGAGIDAAFNTGSGDLALRQRLAERKADFAGGGGAVNSGTGPSGFGSARSR